MKGTSTASHAVEGPFTASHAVEVPFTASHAALRGTALRRADPVEGRVAPTMGVTDLGVRPARPIPLAARDDRE